MQLNFSAIAAAAFQGIVTFEADEALLDAGQPIQSKPYQVGTRNGKPLKLELVLTEG